MHARHAASAAADASGGVGVGGSPPSSDVPLSSTRRRRHDLSYSAAFVRPPPPPCTPPGYLAAVYPNRCTSPLYGQTRRSIRSATLPPAKSLLASPPSRRRPRARFRACRHERHSVSDDLMRPPSQLTLDEHTQPQQQRRRQMGLQMHNDRDKQRHEPTGQRLNQLV